jgi:hypothetical protein
LTTWSNFELVGLTAVKLFARELKGSSDVLSHYLARFGVSS